MYVILGYDVDERRCNKYHRICSRYLLHKQNSLFNGEITEGKLNELINLLKPLIKDKDRITIYKIPSIRGINIEEIGHAVEAFIVT